MIQRYLTLPVIINGLTQLELQNVQVDGDGQWQDVDTMRGLSGFTAGSGRINIQCTSAVRQSGPEFDAVAACKSGVTIEIQIPYGTKTIVTEGIIKTWTLSGAVNQSTEHGFQFTGTYNEPK